MVTLYHYPLCPFSRAVRLMVAEYGLEADFIEERNWDRRADFLALNPAGTVPVMVDDDGTVVCGSHVIFEYLEETRNRTGANGKQLLPGDPQMRAEIRRLMFWFDQKFNEEVTRNLVTEKIDRRFMPREMGGGPPDLEAVRAGLVNIRNHLRYIGYLARQRNWLAGDSLTYADLCAAAHISCVDFLGDVPWIEDQAAYDWYARIKSRPAFRSLLSDQIRGVTPPAFYADLDF
ncbi:MAG: glutathione S-transferase family protein [Fimbriimonadaceae bacterium]|nr:glutathione S-transferase family protein [Alphaproteobacteria bacterium]